MNDSNNNHNPYRELITPDNVVTLFIDHQAAIMTGIGRHRPVRFRAMLLRWRRSPSCTICRWFLAIICLKASPAPILPELVEIPADAPLIHRSWSDQRLDDPAFVKAIATNGSPQLVIAGCTTDICLMFPALSALTSRL